LIRLLLQRKLLFDTVICNDKVLGGQSKYELAGFGSYKGWNKN
jgi:hypothetical protein